MAGHCGTNSPGTSAGSTTPSTGEAEGDRFRLVREAVYRSLETDHGADAVLYLTVRVVDLYMTFRNVSFCGGQDEVNFPGAGYLFQSTLVRATCLHADFYDMDQRHLYGIRHALEVIETYAEQTRAVRPRAARLRNRAVLAAAVEEVVGPFADNAGRRRRPTAGGGSRFAPPPATRRRTGQLPPASLGGDGARALSAPGAPPQSRPPAPWVGSPPLGGSGRDPDR